MKVNQLGTLAIIGVVVSFTVACNGSPTKPTAISPTFDDGAPVASVNLSTVMPVGAVGQICTDQSPTYDENGYQIDAPSVTCVPVAAEQPQENVVVSDAPSMESARFVHRLRR
jgi:hypothetical protein